MLQDQFEVAAVCHISPSAAADAARRFHVPRHLTDYRELLAADLDAVLFCHTDPKTEAAVAVLEAGKHLFIKETLEIYVLGWGSLARVVRGKRFWAIGGRSTCWPRRRLGRARGGLSPGICCLAPSATSSSSPPSAYPVSFLARAPCARTLSFLGIGVVPPMVSWGVLLQDAQRVQVLVCSASTSWGTAYGTRSIPSPPDKAAIAPDGWSHSLHARRDSLHRIRQPRDEAVPARRIGLAHRMVRV